MVADVLAVFALASFVGLLGVVVRRYPSLPAKVASHFGFDGTPRPATPKAVLLVLPIVAAFTYALMALMTLGIAAKGPPPPMGFAWLLVIELNAIFAFVFVQICDVATKRRERLNVASMFAGIGLVTVTVAGFALNSPGR